MKHINDFIDGKVIYHCPTQEQFNTLMEYLMNNYKGIIILKDVTWKTYKERTCVRLCGKLDGLNNILNYSSMDFYVKDECGIYKNMKIVEFNPSLKSQISTRSIVKMRDNTIYFIVTDNDNNLFMERVSGNAYCGFTNFTDDLINELTDECDIVAFKNYNSQAEAIREAKIHPDYIRWDWVREEAKELTIDELIAIAEKELNTKVKIKQGE